MQSDLATAQDVRAALAAVEQGSLVRCEPARWPAVRRGLQDQAGRWIDQGQGIKAVIALREVARLDAEFGHTLAAP
jgi:hypothetical protein